MLIRFGYSFLPCRLRKVKGREKNADTPCSIVLLTVTVCFVNQRFLSITFLILLLPFTN
ncbi:hypothetical protein BFAG_01095 [Bacteroides fragilis 3_1_12]|uniref:Uncharacterized protein n=1 Tax=Bacteroides fragilis 3_1_12 TaxID=457424 RepID=A0ABN0BHM6_BACFG|nr:hypothetical protein BFAG_01095 [Bacteroides fragilis 3_1_12]